MFNVAFVKLWQDKKACVIEKWLTIGKNAFSKGPFWFFVSQAFLSFYFSGMVGPFLEMTLIPEVELRKATIPLFFDLLECEYKAKGSFKQVSPFDDVFWGVLNNKTNGGFILWKNILFLVVDHNLLPTFFMTTSFTSFSPLDYCSLPLMVPLAIFACENKSFGSRKRKIRFSTHI